MPSLTKTRKTRSGSKTSRAVKSSGFKARTLEHIPHVIQTITRELDEKRDTPDQKKVAKKVEIICDVRPAVVKKLGSYMGIPLANLRGKGPNNVCHALGVGLSLLFQRKSRIAAQRHARHTHTFAYPIRTAGAGISGLNFFMSDGTIIKIVKFHQSKGRLRRKGRTQQKRATTLAAFLTNRTRKTYQSGLKSGGHSTPMSEFVHEIAMTKKAHLKLRNTPDIARHIILRGRGGVLLGIMQQTKAPGVTLAKQMERAPRDMQLKLARAHGTQVARTHAANFSHGDMHSANIMVKVDSKDKPTFTIIDFGRATTKRQTMQVYHNKAKATAVWRQIMLFDVAHPYRDHVRDSRAVADAFLAGYVAHIQSHNKKGSARVPIPPIQLIRKEYERMTHDNLNAVLDTVAKIADRRIRKRFKKAK